MSKTFHISAARNGFVATMMLAAILLAYLAPKAAVNVDENLHYPHAKKVVNWYFTLGEDKSCLETPRSNLKYYGQSVDNFTALVNRVFQIENEYLIRHFTGALFFWLLLLFSGMLARSLTGSYTVSIITVFSLLLMPRIFGQAFGNLKDIPFAAGYVAGIFMIVQFFKEIPRPRWRTAILLGLAIAFTVSVRAGGFILFAYLALGLFMFLFWKPFYLKVVSTKPVLVRLLGQGAVIVFIGYFAGLLFWPYALQDVFTHPLESLQVMEHYKVSIRQIFEGELIWSSMLPWNYLPKWILISTPEFVLLGFLLFLVSAIYYLIQKNNTTGNQFFIGFLLLTFLFPLVYVVAIDSNLYSGIRQMMFTLPLLGILSAIGFMNIVKWISEKNRKLVYPFVGIFVLLALLPLKHQAETFPVDYVYFNSISGGNKNAWSNYEYDYYFHGIKEPAEYLTRLAGSEKVTVAMNNNLTNYFQNSQNIEIVYSRYLERSSKNWDYAIFGVNYLHPFLLKNNNWQSTDIIKTFYHKGNPLTVVLKRNDRKDFKGISEIENGNHKGAEKLLRQSIISDPQNVWLYVQMAKLKLMAGEVDAFYQCLEGGKKIHPFYEPLFLLEAQYLYNENRYEEADKVVQELLNINPLYANALELKNAINEKLKNKS
jgi:tetratricopeptide (TPR) repeat protein